MPSEYSLAVNCDSEERDAGAVLHHDHVACAANANVINTSACTKRVGIGESGLIRGKRLWNRAFARTTLYRFSIVSSTTGNNHHQPGYEI